MAVGHGARRWAMALQRVIEVNRAYVLTVDQREATVREQLLFWCGIMVSRVTQISPCGH